MNHLAGIKDILSEEFIDVKLEDDVVRLEIDGRVFEMKELESVMNNLSVSIDEEINIMRMLGASDEVIKELEEMKEAK